MAWYSLTGVACPAGDIYQGDCCPGDRQATAEEVEASYAPSTAHLLAYAETAQAAFLDRGQVFNVAAAGQPAVNLLCDGKSQTRADLGLLAIFGQANPSGTRTWLDNSGVGTAVTGSQLAALATAVEAWVSATYPALATLNRQITGDPTASPPVAPSITTTAQIDAYAWPTS